MIFVFLLRLCKNLEAVSRLSQSAGSCHFSPNRQKGKTSGVVDDGMLKLGNTVEEGLAAVGFGKFQYLVLIYAGFGWFSEAMEIMILSFAMGALLGSREPVNNCCFCW